MSAAEFARRHSINYTTFCGWRRRAREMPAPGGLGLVEVEIEESADSGVVVDLGNGCSARIKSKDQARLMASLLREMGGARC